MSQWLLDNKVMEIIFGTGTHIEIVKRSQPIIKFLARFAPASFDDSIVDLVWRCQDGKHEEMVRTVYEVIEHVVPYLSLENVDKFFNKIRLETRIDEKYLLFLKQFTVNAMHKQIQEQENRWATHME
jgi:hypothetical protein